jgi:hypothetical protein
MPFRNPHVSSVTFCLEIGTRDQVEVMVIETDLHLNSRHPDYNEVSVQRLIQAGRAYLIEHGHNAAVIRLACNRGGEI